MKRQPQIALHIGAHKTATTHLQKSLRQSGQALRAAGHAFLPTVHYRQTLGPLQIELRDGAPVEALMRTASDMVRGAANRANRLILSDENILGNMPRVIKGSRLYPWSKGRVERTVRLLSLHPVQTYLTIRNPADWLPSSYCESLRHGPWQSFERFCSVADLDALSWADLVGRLLPVLPNRQIHIWRYEDYAANHRQIGKFLLDGADAEVEFLTTRPRPGLSARAVQALGDLVASGADPILGDRITEVAEAFPTGPDWPLFAPFDGPTRAKFDAQYAQDWQALRDMPGVTLFDPLSKAAGL